MSLQFRAAMASEHRPPLSLHCELNGVNGPHKNIKSLDKLTECNLEGLSVVVHLSFETLTDQNFDLLGDLIQKQLSLKTLL